MGQFEGDNSNTSVADEGPESSSASADSSWEESTSEWETPRHLAEKAGAVRRACDQRDFDALVSHAISEGGFVRDDVRQLACKWILCSGIISRGNNMHQGRFFCSATETGGVMF